MERLSEEAVTSALDAMDWNALREHLDAAELDEDSAGRLVTLVLCARTLVFRYPGNKKKRARILDGVSSVLGDRLGEEAASFAQERFAMFATIDEAYSGLRALIASEPLAGRSPEYRLSAYLEHISMERDAIAKQIEQAQSEPRVAGTLTLTAPDGTRYGADAAIDMFVQLTSMNITLSAYNGKWFGPDDVVRVPQLPAVDGGDAQLAGASSQTALVWREWQMVEERARHYGGDLERLTGDEVPEPFRRGVALIDHRVRGVEWEMFDTIANERLGDRLSQTFHEMMAETSMSARAAGIDATAALPPDGLVSVQEGHSGVMMCEFLGFDVIRHPVEYGGLSLREWLRGYAVLQQLAQRSLAGTGSPHDRAFPSFELSELEDLLHDNGLADSKARRFLDHASFARSSRDLYDAPIIRGTDDRCLLAAPALEGALLVRLILSALANAGLQIEEKGKAFEASIRREFEKQGLATFAFEAKRGGEQFEYDAVLPWGGYLFVFECKNRGLSGTNPIASFNFLRSITGHIRQANRLAEALVTYPDILTGHIPVNCTGLKIVPVVVSSMPFSYPGDIDGVYFTDASALGRFFSDRNSNVVRYHRVGPAVLKHRIPTRAQWKGEAPDADDFMAHLENPLQLEIMRAHFRIEPQGFQIGPALYALTQRPRRKEMTLDSMAAIGGITAKQIEDEQARFEREVVAPLREKLADGGGRTLSDDAD